jgi:protein gp37
MADRSKIEWTEATWNPVTGCTKLSLGCENCYAERMALRLKAIGCSTYRNGFRVTVHTHLLRRPLSWRSPRTIFVNSMSDLFHPAVDVDFIKEVFRVMAEAPQHRFQVLTKRSRRLLDIGDDLEWSSNVWMGVTVEHARYRFRIDHLRQTKAAVKFLSLEPLLGPLPALDLGGISWVIVGGESGPKARPVQAEWVIDIRDQCVTAGVPFFFKQWGGINKRQTGRLLENRVWDQMPEIIAPEGDFCGRASVP